MTKTMIIVILDESGSMANKKADVLGGFNTFMDEQKAITSDTARLYLIKFNASVNVVHNGLDMKYVPALTDETYRPGGGTALYDAIAEAVSLAEKGKNPDERVICVIMTDGEENSSRRTTKQQVKDLISGHEIRGDWTFIYIGENPERWAADTGMCAGNVTRYDHAQPQQAHMQAHFACMNLRQSTNTQMFGALSSAPPADIAAKFQPIAQQKPPLFTPTPTFGVLPGTGPPPPFNFGVPTTTIINTPTFGAFPAPNPNP